jgi:uncharacterized Zn finger protein
MAIAFPRIHMICGICGNKDMLSYQVLRDADIENEGEKNEKKYDAVYISCENCSSLTGLDEVIKHNKEVI